MREPINEGGYEVEKAAGRATFAAILLLIAGTLNIIYGIGALDGANIFTNDTRYILTNLNTLGWVLIVLGVIQLTGGFSLIAGNTYGRVIGIIGGGLGAISALLSIGGRTRGGRWPSSSCACGSSTASSSSATTRARRQPDSRLYRGRMGFLRRDDEPDGERFQMREKLLAIGDDFWIENDQGERAYKVNGKAVRLRETFVLEDTSGDEVARIQERKLSVRDKVAIERGGDRVATVHKALVGIRDGSRSTSSVAPT